MIDLLSKQGHEVNFIYHDELDNTLYQLIPDKASLENNFFSNAKLVGQSRSEILKGLQSEKLKYIHQKPELSIDLSTSTKLSHQRKFDLAILAGPWVYNPSHPIPSANSYKCIALDCIPIKYYFSNPNAHGLRLFAHEHNRGYRWANEQANGILSLSEATRNDLIKYGYGDATASNMKIIPTLIPPGFSDIRKEEIQGERKRTVILAAPFDPRKGLLEIPKMVNNGEIDKLIIFGRPRCPADLLQDFFEKIDIDDITWYIDIDFKTQKKLYLQSRVLLFPSHNEGLGIPILEAYSSGCRVLCYKKLETSYLLLPEDRMGATESFHDNLNISMQLTHQPDKYWLHARKIASEASNDSTICI